MIIEAERIKHLSLGHTTNSVVRWDSSPCLFDIKTHALYDTAKSMNSFLEKTEVQLAFKDYCRI